jgi:hypothetical protein
MATVQEIQDQLGNGGKDALIVRGPFHVTASLDHFWVEGLADAAGRARWCETTAAETAAQQAADILVALRE